jgi:hypothetical protein
MTQLSFFPGIGLTDSDYAVISSIISKTSPLQPIHVMKREIAKAFPTLKWHIKKTEEEWYSAVASVVSADGELIAANAKEWFAEQIRASGSDRLISRIRAEDLRLARTEGGAMYAMGVDLKDPLNFCQVRIQPQTRAIFSLGNIRATHLEYAPDGYPFDWTNAERPAVEYVCNAKDAINSLRWLERCKLSESEHREFRYAELGKLTLTQYFLDGRPDEVTPFFEAHPEMLGWNKRPGREERWFADWKVSSAGNEPMGLHWYLDTKKYTEDGIEIVGFIPQGILWPKKLVRTRGLSPSQLLEKLRRFDRIVKCEFGWFFYMIHGNRITDEAGKMIAAGVRAGKLHLEQRDAAVLLAWADDPYCF